MIKPKWVTMSGMNNQQRGMLNVLLLPFLLLLMAAIGLGAFAFWAYGSRQDYKTNVDQKIDVAVQAAVQQAQKADAQQYAQDAKYPLSSFSGPASFGSVSLKYPKTWSAYVAEESDSENPINGYFYPAIVPDVTNTANNYSLRVQLLEQSYTTSMQAFSGSVASGQLAVSQYTLPKLPSVIGSELQGQLSSTTQGTMVVLPLLNMTLEVWTEAPQFQSDFANIILPNLTFLP
jgi:hypothetical protein